MFTVAFRNRERITFDHLVSMKKPNDTAQIRVLRGGEEKEFTVTLRPVSKVSFTIIHCRLQQLILLLHLSEQFISCIQMIFLCER